jgi:hypothetical protein
MCFRRRPSRREKLSALRTEISVVSDEIERRIREADFRLAQENRLAPYMFLALVGVLGLYNLNDFQPAVDFLATHPTWVLALVLLLLWFPVYSVIALTDQAKALLWVRDIGAPLLNELIRQQRELAEIVLPQEPDGSQYALWDSERNRTFVKIGPREVSIDWVLMPLTVARGCIVTMPAVGLFVFGYLFPLLGAPDTSSLPWELGLYIAIAVLVIFMVMAMATWSLALARVRITVTQTVDNRAVSARRD